jgi:hypothetical protein
MKQLGDTLLFLVFGFWRRRRRQLRTPWAVVTDAVMVTGFRAPDMSPRVPCDI